MHTIAAGCVHVPESVDLETIGNASVDIREDPAVEQRVGARVDVEFVTASGKVISYATQIARDRRERTPSRGLWCSCPGNHLQHRSLRWSHRSHSAQARQRSKRDVHVRELSVVGEGYPVATVETIRDHADVPRAGVEPVHLIREKGQRPETVQIAITVLRRPGQRFVQPGRDARTYVTSVK